jgi:hypothetical protein
MRGADDLVAVDLADRARHLNLRNLVCGQRDVLLEFQAGLIEQMLAASSATAIGDIGRYRLCRCVLRRLRM